MKNTKERNNKLMRLADEAVRKTGALFKENNKSDIAESYNGKIAGFSVSIAMSGLLPTLAMYYQDGDEKQVKTKVYLRNILTVVSAMIAADGAFDEKITDAKSLLEYAINNPQKEGDLKKEVIDCAIALKQVVRTYNLE